MPRKLTNEIVDQRLRDDERTIERRGDYVNTSTKIEWACKVCNHTWLAAPKSILRGSGCPACAGSLPLTNEIVDKRLADADRTVERRGDYVSSETKIEWRCLECDHTWLAIPTNVLKGNGCPVCGGNLPLTNEIADQRLNDDGRTIIRLGDFVTTSTKIEWACKVCGNEWLAAPNGVLGGSDCSACSGNLPLTNEIVDQRLVDTDRTL